MRRGFIVLFLAGLAVRLALLVLEPTTVPVADERVWLIAGLGSLAERANFSPLLWRQIFYPPLFPYMIGIGNALGGMTAVTVLQVLASSLLIPAVGRIGDRLGSERVGTAAAALAAFWPEFVWHAVHFWAEPLYLTLLFWSFERLLVASSVRRAGAALTAGVLFGLATLTREPALYFAPLAALWLAWRAASAGRRQAAVFLIATLVTLAPWTLRNWVVYRAFIPVSLMSGRTLWEGNTSLSHSQVFRRYNAIRGGRDAALKQYRIAVESAVDNIVARQPWWFFEKLGEQMPRFWAADNLALIHMGRGAYGLVSPTSFRLVALVTLAPYLALMLAFLVGVCRVRWSSGIALLLGFLLYYCLVHVVVHGHPRFRLPVTPIVMLVAAVAWLAPLEERVAWTNPRRAVAALLSCVFGIAIAPGLRHRWKDPAWGLVPAQAEDGPAPRQSRHEERSPEGVPEHKHKRRHLQR
jgi:hypothetical protein